MILGFSGADRGGEDSGSAYVVFGKRSSTAVNVYALGTGGFRSTVRPPTTCSGPERGRRRHQRRWARGRDRRGAPGRPGLSAPRSGRRLCRLRQGFERARQGRGARVARVPHERRSRTGGGKLRRRWRRHERRRRCGRHRRRLALLRGRLPERRGLHRPRIRRSPPKARITSAPRGATNHPTPTFRFTSSEPGSSFRCKLDTGAYSACSSPKTAAHLTDDSHTFYVRARDSGGHVDSTRRSAPSPSAPPRSGSRARRSWSPPRRGRRTTFRSPGPSASIFRVTDFPSGAYTGSGVHTGFGCTRSGRLHRQLPRLGRSLRCSRRPLPPPVNKLTGWSTRAGSRVRSSVARGTTHCRAAWPGTSSTGARCRRDAGVGWKRSAAGPRREPQIKRLTVAAEATRPTSTSCPRIPTPWSAAARTRRGAEGRGAAFRTRPSFARFRILARGRKGKRRRACRGAGVPPLPRSPSGPWISSLARSK